MARRIAQVELWLGIGLLAVIVVLVFIASVMRFFNHPLIWSVDLAQLLFIWLCFVGASRAMRERSHLGVDLLVRYLGQRWRLAIELALAAIFIAFLAVLAWQGYQLTVLNRERIFGDSGLPYAYVTIAVPIGCLLLSLSIIFNAIEAWRRRGGGELLVFSRIGDTAEQHQEL